MLLQLREAVIWAVSPSTWAFELQNTACFLSQYHPNISNSDMRNTKEDMYMVPCLPSKHEIMTGS